MLGYDPQPGFASFKKVALNEVTETNGLLLPTQAAEETLIRGVITSVNNGESGYDFSVNEEVVVCPGDVLGILTENGTSHHIVKVEDILGRVFG